MDNKFQNMNCPICKSELIDSFELFCPNEECCYITEMPNIVNDKNIIALLYENEKLIKWIEILNGKKYWYLNGKIHREDGPAVEYPDGRKDWCFNGKYHREDGPAIEFKDGYKEWRLNGELHRENGPAIEDADDAKSWYLNGKLHREDGPALEYVGVKEWWINGEFQKR